MDNAQSTPPLYHYTNNSGLVGMFSSQELWFSDIRFLNDSREYKHACDLLAKYIRKCASTHRQGWIDAGCTQDKFDGMINNMCKGSTYERVQQNSSWEGFPFVFSLTQKRDSLNQWRSYGSGYCIEIDVKSIQSHALRLIKVAYKRDEDEDGYLSRVVNDFFSSNIRKIHPDGGLDQETYYAGIEDIVYKLWSSDFFVKHKDEGFHEEEEWRLVMYVDRSSAEFKNVFFDPSGRYPRPRLKIRPNAQEYPFSDIAKEIICGPGLDYELCMASISLMRLSKTSNMFWGNRISYSNIPYRPD